MWWLNFVQRIGRFLFFFTPCGKNTKETWKNKCPSSHFIAHRLCHFTWYVFAFSSLTAQCRHFSTTASNTIPLRARLWEKICAHIYISTLLTQNCQIRTKDSVWAHCVTVRGLRCPAGQDACKFSAISIISLKMAFLQDTRHSPKVHNLNP